MKILFCGGGTVGHISPAIAIAEGIKKDRPDAELLFIGRVGGDENSVIENAGIKLEKIEIQGLSRKRTFKNIKKIYTAIKAQWHAKKIIKEFNPDIVIGTGGYVCWPVLSAAQNMKIPTIIHESNACPGLSTKLVSSRCTKVLLGFKGSEKEFSQQNNLIIVGNPVKEEFLNASKKNSRKKLGIGSSDFLICSFGGSGGSEVLNNSVISLMKGYISKKKHTFHIHSCGKKYYADIKRKNPELIDGKFGCTIKPYIENMAELISAADIVISRCGAITLAEMCAIGCCAILIPSPNVTNDHQTKNAKLITDSNAAIMIKEKDLTERSLLDTIRSLENNPAKRRDMQYAIKKFSIPDCTEKIIECIYEIIQQANP